MGIEDVDNLTDQVEDQIQTAVDSAQVVLFVVDCRDGPAPLDQEVAKRLRYVTAPVLLVVNKPTPRRWTPRPTSSTASGGRWSASAPRRTGARPN